ncbi:protein rep [Kordiimonas sp.]|uniref:protein rep n=1 Tax=Kordiimonas sp. TaxID=1970157 RepID=UPI003B526B68
MPFDAEPSRVSQAVLPRSESIRKKRHRLRKTAGQILPRERVRNCGCHRHSDVVDIHRSDRGAHFVGVETCGSVWLCPVCSAKIAETRREEVAEAITGITGEGGSSYMLTLTMRHGLRDPLDFLKEQIVNGWRKVQNRRAYRAIKEEFGVVGTIRAIEVTHGKNGWHPHLHILFLFEGPLFKKDEANVQNALFTLWADVLDKAGGGYVSLDALDFRPATASDYVTKWGTDRELVKGQEKLGNGSRSPWQLLDAFSCGDKQAGALFREYAETFKGTRQLTWSKGLKARYGIGELDDLDAAKEATEADEQLPLDDGLKEGRIGTLDRGTFDAVVRLGLTADLLDAAHSKGWRGVTTLLSKHKLATYHDDSFAWKQPPKGGRPAHPKYYLNWNHKEFRESVETGAGRSRKTA